MAKMLAASMDRSTNLMGKVDIRIKYVVKLLENCYSPDCSRNEKLTGEEFEIAI